VCYPAIGAIGAAIGLKAAVVAVAAEPGCS